ncbi:MAG TPA: D-2-hydroxyacid dehydrogenase [Sporolactobacillaceae bacterium]|nr:D-2-hydroxyacid dehydrogenase [Sporolactobacillaceae bacterium]
MLVLSSARIQEDLQHRLIKNYPDIDFRFYRKMEEAAKDLPMAEVLITYGEDLTEDLINQANSLRWIMVISAGLDRMPFKAIKEKGIIVTNARGIHKIPMAEYTLAAMLQWSKKTKEWVANQKEHVWSKYGIKMNELAYQNITVIGTGAIGSEIARLAKAFRMKTFGVNRSGNKAEHFDEIFTVNDMLTPISQSAVVVSVLPYTNETDHLIGKKHFEALPDHSLFINIGRGKTVDQDALLEELRKREMSAVLDVFEQEPLPLDHPFWDMPNVTITPHFSSITSQYQPRSIEIFEENLLKYKKRSEDLINLIDLDRGY